MSYQIWKDNPISISGTSATVRILDASSNVIFYGKVYAKPGESSISFNPNEIIKSYLTRTMPALTSGTTGDLGANFIVQKLSGSSWVAVRTTSEYIPDYSYQPMRSIIAEPVNGRVLAGQIIPVSGNGGVTLGYYSASGSRIGSRSLGTSGKATVTMVTTEYGSTTAAYMEITKSGESAVRYYIIPFCGQPVIYYRNAFGGYDSLVVEGQVKERDDVVRHNIKVAYNNAIAENRGTFQIANELTHIYTITTGWLSDAEAARMHHLMNSPEVYILDSVNNVLHPVVLTGTTTEYKTFRGNGGQLVNYTIEAAVAQDFERR